MQGHIIKGYSGFYYVARENKIYECSLRGKNRKSKTDFLPGDLVEFEAINEEKGVIERVLERKNQLIRPAIANVEQIIIVTSAKDPQPDLMFVDRMSVIALYNKIEPIICFSKGDLLNNDERQSLINIYKNSGFNVLITSVVDGSGIDELKGLLHGKISVFAGNSGVGKSSLVNAVTARDFSQVGEISTKLKRGKHTTRHVELFSLDEESFIADTPGFSSLNLPEGIKREQLGRFFPDFMEYLEKCRFNTCLHNSEPDCAVKDAVQKGFIAQSRYENYLILLNEVIAQERSY